MFKKNTIRSKDKAILFVECLTMTTDGTLVTRKNGEKYLKKYGDPFVFMVLWSREYSVIEFGLKYGEDHRRGGWFFYVVDDL